MLVFNNKAICFNSTAIDFAYYNWQDIHPSFIKSQTYSNYHDSADLMGNCGGFIVHIPYNALRYTMPFSALDYYYGAEYPLCYYSATDTPFVEPTQLMKRKYRKPEGLELCKAYKHRQSETILNGAPIINAPARYEGTWDVSIKFVPPTSSKGAGYYVFDDSYFVRNNIPYIVEFTTVSPYTTPTYTAQASAGSGCAIWMGKVPWTYSFSAAYPALNKCTFSSINNVDISVQTKGPSATPVFAPGELGGTQYNPTAEASYIKQLSNVKINQVGTGPGCLLLANDVVYHPGMDLSVYSTSSHLDKCINVSSNVPVYCNAIGSMNNCTNVFTGNPV